MSIRYLSGINVDNNVLFVDDANNRVGVGTASPSTSLDVIGTVTAYRYQAISSSASLVGYGVGTGLGMFNAGTDTLGFATASTERLRITAAGNVGIGTTNPSYRLDVDAVSATNVARFYNSSNTATQVEIGDSGNSQYSNLLLISDSGQAEIWKSGTGYTSYGGALALNIYNSNGAIAFHPNNTQNAMFIATTGNVGIGTTAPGAKLQVSGTIATNSSLSDVDAYRIIKPNGGALSTSTPSATGAIRITYPVGFTNTMHRVKVNIYEYTTNESFTIYFGGYNYAPDSLWYNEFAYVVNNPGTDRNFTVRFGYNGTKMVVYIGELASTWAYPQVFIEEVELGYGGQSSAWRDDAWAIGFEATAFQNVSKTVSNPQATNWARNGSSTYYSLGNVGIGTTSPFSKLEVLQAASGTPLSLRSQAGNSGNVGLRFSIADNTVTTDAYNKAAIYLAGTGATNALGDMVFAVNNTASSVNVSLADERMRITRAGNVGIGTTSPSALLNVAGSVTIGSSSVPTVNLYLTRTNGGVVADANYFVSGNNTPNQTWIEGGYYTGELAGVVTSPNSGYPYIETYAGQGSATAKSFGFVNKTSGSFISTDFLYTMALLRTGQIRFHQYGSGSFTGTVAYNLAVDSSGNIIETAGGVVDGSGTANYVSKWSDANTLTNSVLYDDGTNVGIGTTAPNAKLNVNTNAMGVTVSDSSGISLTNGTAAAAGAQQMSPTLRWSGQGWATTPLASRNVSFISFLTPQQGTTNPSGILNFASSINGGAYSSVMSLTTGGALTITAGFSATSGTFTSTINNTISGLATTPTDGIVTVNGTAATAGVPVQISPRLRISGTAWNTGGTPASNTMNWTIDNLSTSGNPPTSALRFNFDRNGGGYSTLVSFISNGNVGIGTTSPTEKLHVVGNELITGTLEVDTVNNGSGDFLTRTSGGIVTRRTAAEVRSDIQASQYFTVSSSSWIPASTSGWFRLASTSGSQRGSVRVILSFIGGNFTPQNYIIDVTKDWTTTASLRVDVRTAQSQYISGVRVIQDTVNTNVYHLEANFASSLNPYQFDLSFDNAYGFNGTWTMATTAPLVASTNGTVILSKDIFLSGDYSTDLINTGNINISGNTLSSINTNGNIILSPNGSGNVGIGTTSPAQKLTVSGSTGDILGITNGTTTGYGYVDNNGFGLFTSSGGGGTGIYYRTANIIDHYVNGSIAMRLNSTGNVGIGTTSPSGRLEVSGGSGPTGVQSYFSTGAGYTDPAAGNAAFPGGAKIILWNDTSTPQKASIGMDGNADIWFNNAGGQAGAGFTFYTGDGASATPSARLKITKAGNVGIGTTSPSYKLDVVGTTRSTTLLSTNATGSTGLNITSATASGGGSVIRLTKDAADRQVYQTFESDQLYLGVPASNTTIGEVGTKGSVDLRFATAYSERMRITAAGDVGIGTTSPSTKLHVFTTSNSDQELLRLTVAPANSSGAKPKAILGFYTPAEANTQDYTSGRITSKFDIAGYANSRVTIESLDSGGNFIETLTAKNGNVGIGNTTPSQKLHVTGNVRVTGAYYDSSNSAGSSGQVLSSTGSGTAWVNQGEATATSLYDLLPAARTTYDWTVQLTAGTWADIFSSNTVLSNGTWMVQAYVNDFAVGGQQYQETYSGIMSWGNASSTNEIGPEAISEIVLHRSGHAANTGNFYLRTVERASSTLLLQGMSNQTYSAASTINFKFVKIF